VEPSLASTEEASKLEEAESAPDTESEKKSSVSAEASEAARKKAARKSRRTLRLMDHVPSDEEADSANAAIVSEMQKRVEQLIVDLAVSKNNERHYKHKAQHLRLLLDAAGGNTSALEQLERMLTDGKDLLVAAKEDNKALARARDDLKQQLENASRRLAELREQESRVSQLRKEALLEKDGAIATLKAALEASAKQLTDSQQQYQLAVAAASASPTLALASAATAPTVVEPQVSRSVTSARVYKPHMRLLSPEEERYVLGYIAGLMAVLVVFYLLSALIF